MTSSKFGVMAFGYYFGIAIFILLFKLMVLSLSMFMTCTFHILLGTLLVILFLMKTCGAVRYLPHICLLVNSIVLVKRLFDSVTRGKEQRHVIFQNALYGFFIRFLYFSFTLFWSDTKKIRYFAQL